MGRNDPLREAKRAPQRPSYAVRGALTLLTCAAVLLQTDADSGTALASSNTGSTQGASGPTAIASSCALNGRSLAGRVKVVDAFPDLKVKVVDAFPDLNVRWVDAFPDACGRWKRVDTFPDFTIQFVDAFPDLTIREVDAFPGLP